MTTDYLFSPTMTASLIAIALFLFVFCFVSIKGKKSTLKGQWLFDNFFENITDSFFQEDQLNKVARKLSNLRLIPVLVYIIWITDITHYVIYHFQSQ